jgi:hypothetical protein
VKGTDQGPPALDAVTSCFDPGSALESGKTLSQVHNGQQRTVERWTQLPSFPGMAFLVMLAAFALFPPTQAFPLSERTVVAQRDDVAAARSTGYVKGTNRRGNLDPKISCLDTILLCGWTTVQLNVLAAPESKIKEIGRRILWMIMAAISPEFVLFQALEQFNAARSQECRQPDRQEWCC